MFFIKTNKFHFMFTLLRFFGIWFWNILNLFLIYSSQCAPTGIGFLCDSGLLIVSRRSRAHLYGVERSEEDSRLYGVGHSEYDIRLYAPWHINNQFYCESMIRMFTGKTLISKVQKMYHKTLHLFIIIIYLYFISCWQFTTVTIKR